MKPDENSSENDICLNNLRIADKYHDLDYFIVCSYGWLKLNPNSNYQDFEKFLRNNNFDTHLIVSKIKNMDDAYLNIPHNDKINMDLKYRCIFSCRSKDDASKELYEHWPNYDENYEALEFAGCLTVKKSEDLDLFDSKNNIKAIKYDKDKRNILDLLSKNELKLEVETLLPNDIYSRLIKQAKNILNIIPTEIKLVTFADNSYIFILCDKDTPLIDLAFMRKPDTTDLELIKIEYNIST